MARFAHSGLRAARAGYTLVELLIVCTLLGIAAAVVAPSVSSTGVLRVQSVVRSIVADLTFAQSDGLARQGGRAIVFDVAGNSYAIVEVHGATLHPETDTILNRNLSLVDKRGGSRITAASFDGSNVLVFDELGGPVQAPASNTPGSGGVIVVEGQGSTFNITVEPYTGRITVAKVQ